MILGIDTGIVHIGIALCDIDNHAVLYMEEHSAETGNLCDYFKYFANLVDRLNPQRIVFEQPFQNQNVIKGKKYGISEIIAIQKLVAEFKNIPMLGLSPSTVKKRFTGNGVASKEEIKDKVIAEFNIDQDSTHINDAIAIAFSYGVYVVQEKKPKKRRRKKVTKK